MSRNKSMHSRNRSQHCRRTNPAVVRPGAKTEQHGLDPAQGLEDHRLLGEVATCPTGSLWDAGAAAVHTQRLNAICTRPCLRRTTVPHRDTYAFTTRGSRQASPTPKSSSRSTLSNSLKS